MSELMILGSKPVNGTIQVAGAKNAVLPEMAACLLTDKKVVLHNVPRITDVEEMKKKLQAYGVKVTENGTSLSLNARNVRPKPQNADGTDIGASFLVAGPLVARFQEPVHVYPPNGCAINKKGRPVDYHINALKKMGAEWEHPCGNIHVFTAENGLHAEDIDFEESSVGATENIMMAACLVKRETRIKNAAVEPEVIDLVKMLKKMGANIEVDEERKMITIRGNGEFLSGTTHTVVPDRIEAGTYAIAAAIVGGTLLLKMDPEVGQEILVPVIEKLRLAGVEVTPKCDGLEIKRSGQINPVSITIGPFPAFPTDLLPQWATFMTQAQGTSTLNDTIYDNRFNHFSYLETMGARFSKVSDKVYQVNGPVKLRGTHVKATDLRAGMALILAGLAAEETTVVKEIKHVLRGYENLKENLKQCGAKFEELRPTRPGFYGFSQY